jgi:hypothetical protein
VDEWRGELAQVTDESVEARFYELDQLPEASDERFAQHHTKVFADFKRFDGNVMLD